MEAQQLSAEKPFHSSMEKFLELISMLEGSDCKEMQISTLEAAIETEGREVCRRLLEEHIKLRGTGDIGESVQGSDGVLRTHRRVREVQIKTIFGEIKVGRVVYSKPGVEGLAPKEAMLNMPENSYSHGLERRIGSEVAKASFEEAQSSVKEQTGVTIPKRQAEMIARNIAQDFEAFYQERNLEDLRKTTRKNDVLVLTTDGKGVVMRKDDLREATKQRAGKDKKLKKRLSKGEKKNSKRMAQVASVYSIARNERTVEDIMQGGNSNPAPKPQAKRVWASLELEADEVIGRMFDEADRRDPKHKRDWTVLVDGQNHQLELIEQELKKRRLNATIVVDLIHVIEYLWKASRCFYAEDSDECEQWVKHYLTMILEGNAKQAASGMRRSATRQELKVREAVDTCANYLHNKAEYLNYDQYLARGLPIATGVIEGACRHLVKDRMDVTGARWSLNGAESVLRLRSIYASGDWNDYWDFHVAQDYERNHRRHYANPKRLEKSKLRIVK